MSSPTVASSGRSYLPPQLLVVKRRAARPSGVTRKDRSRVAQPDIAVARGNELGGLAHGRACRSLGLGAVHQKPDLVALSPVAFSERAHERRHVATRCLEITVPFVRIGRPCRPDGLLRRPLRRHGDHRLLGHGGFHDISSYFPRHTVGAWRSPSIDNEGLQSRRYLGVRKALPRLILTNRKFLQMRPAAMRQVARTPQYMFLKEQRDASVSVQMGRSLPVQRRAKSVPLTKSDRGRTHERDRADFGGCRKQRL